ncbi:unnamed protein product [Cochlearia groenlandica]
MSSSQIESEKKTMVSPISDTLFSTKTPDKSAILHTRSRNSEVKPQISRDPNLKSVKRQILSSPPKPETSPKLPESFEILEEFFNGLDSSIRLLKLKGSLTSFINISAKIKCLTKRTFSYEHLAQMKHIYPEAIEVKRVLKYDEGSSCMKPSLHVNLNTDSIVLDDTSCGRKYTELRKVFRTKLVDFYKAHPKDEIPKELLPEPFNSSERDGYLDTIGVDSGESKLENEGFDISMEEIEQKQEDAVDKVIPVSTLSDDDATEECLVSHAEPKIVGTPVKDLSTPCKDLSTPIRLMSATPTLKSSRRSITMTPNEDNDSVRSINTLEKRPSRTRCLNFDILEEDVTVKNDISHKCDDVSVNEGINYVADDASDEDSLLHSMKEKPKAEHEKQNLPKLVDLIHKLFHSTKRTIITKEELIHKSISTQIDITDRREVEEQFRLLLQLLPDWISETKASSGDLLVRINKTSTVETVRETLDEATSHGVSAVY